MNRNEKSLRFLQDAFWRERISGTRELSDEKIFKRMEHLKLHFTGSCYCVVIFAPYLMEKEADEIDELLSMLLEQVHKAYNRAKMECYTISDDYCNVVNIIALQEETDYQRLNEITRVISAKLIDKHNLEMFVGIGEIVKRFSHLSKSKETAAEALAYKFSFSKDHVITAKDVQRYYNKGSVELKQHYDWVLGCFYDANISLLAIRFQNLCNEVKDASPDGLDAVRNVCIEITATLLRVVREMGIIHTMELGGIYTHIAQLESVSKIQEWFLAYCTGLLQKISEFRQDRKKKLLEQAESYIEEALGVDMPKFALGFKESYSEPVRTVKETLLMNLALDIIAGKVSPLYSKMLSEGLINTSFGKEYFTGRGFSAPIFTGESNNPEKVKEEILSEIARIRKNGIRDEDFEVSLKKLYGAEVFSYNDVDDLANNLIDAYFNGHGLFDTIELYKEIRKEDVEKIISDSFKEEFCCLSVIK